MCHEKIARLLDSGRARRAGRPGRTRDAVAVAGGRAAGAAAATRARSLSDSSGDPGRSLASRRLDHGGEGATGPPCSLHLEATHRRVAVKIVDDRGIESLRIVDLEDAR